MKQESKFGFGQVLQDNISGFKGAVMAITHYATGCTHYSLAPLTLKDGVPHDWQSFDEIRLTDTGELKNVGPLTVGLPTPGKRTGGPEPKTVMR